MTAATLRPTIRGHHPQPLIRGITRSIFSNLRRNARRVALAGAAVATVAGVGGVAAGTAGATSPAQHRAAISCWYEYDFTHCGKTLIA